MRGFYFSLSALIFILCGCEDYMLQGRRESVVTDSISKSMYSVTFSGAAYMKRAEAEKYTLQRACELALKKGYTHFVVLEKVDDSDLGSFQDISRDTTITGIDKSELPQGRIRPNIKLKIQCYNKSDAPADAIDAQQYLDENFPK